MHVCVAHLTSNGGAAHLLSCQACKYTSAGKKTRGGSTKIFPNIKGRNFHFELPLRLEQTSLPKSLQPMQPEAVLITIHLKGRHKCLEIANLQRQLIDLTLQVSHVLLQQFVRCSGRARRRPARRTCSKSLTEIHPPLQLQRLARGLVPNVERRPRFNVGSRASKAPGSADFWARQKKSALAPHSMQNLFAL